MKFYPLSNTKLDDTVLNAGYKNAREIGKARLGDDCLFIREKFKTYYVSYNDITRVFRRVVLVPAKMCCGKGDFEIEHIVVCTEAGELAQLQMPGERAGKIMLDELAKKASHAAVGKPESTESDAPAECTL